MSATKDKLAARRAKELLETGLRLLFVLLVLSVSNASADEPQMRMQLDNDQIYIGESATLRIVVSDANDPPEIDLSGLEKDFSVEFLGRNESRSQQIVISNGRPQVTNNIKFVYPYRLTPKRAGRLEIPSLTVDADGFRISARGTLLNVLEPQDQDLVLLKISSTPKTVYPLQNVTIRLQVFVKAIPDPEYTDRDPVSIATTRELTIPWFSSDAVPKSLQPAQSLQDVVSPLIENRPRYGFEINGLSQREGFFSTRTLTFCPRPEREMRTDKSGKETEYWVYSFDREFIPQEQGEFSFGPVICKGRFISAVEDGAADAERIYAVSPTYNLRVKDIPLEGRPDSYIGTFGKFDFKSKLSPVRSRVGDPMTLTLTLRGKGALKQAIPPDINKIPEVAANFKTYEATQDTTADTRKFTYSLRPTSTEVTSFPPVSIAYFDVDMEEYVIKTSDEIPIEISQAEALSTDEIMSAPNDPAANEGIETNAAGLFGNQTDPAKLRNQSVDVRNWMYAWAGLLGFWCAGSMLIRRLQRRHGDTSALRRRRAVSRARKALAGIDTDSGGTLIDGIRSSIVGLVADVVECNESGLATRDVTEHLRALQLDDDEIQPVTQFLESCDASRYGGGADSDKLKSAADQVLNGLIRAFTRRQLLK